MKQPFEANYAEIHTDPEPFVQIVFNSLQSQFLIMPRGQGFVDYPVFDKAYEALKQATDAFTVFNADAILPTVLSIPVSLCVLRAILGFTPPELAHMASEQTGTNITQSQARSIDRNIRMAPLDPISPSPARTATLRALVDTACHLITIGAPNTSPRLLHRLDKADTRGGLTSISPLAALGVPYSMLLYERFLGRSFASHRDSVSEHRGDLFEVPIESLLDQAHISHRKTRRAETIPGFDQAPDFIIPDEFNPRIVIEAKVAEDDGTARDKVTRIQHLAEISASSNRPFQVVACIDGRGFGIRRSDIRKLLIATHGKVFTLSTLDSLIDHTNLRNFRTP